MNSTGKQVLASVCATALITFLVPSEASAQRSRVFDCGKPGGKTLQSVLDTLEPGDTLLLRGTCNENVLIHAGHRDITIDGGGTATVTGPSATSPTVDVRGKGITVKGLRVVGGRIGVRLTGGATGTVDTCNVSGAAVHGVGAFTNSQVRVVDSTIEGNASSGVCICEHASGYVGLRSDSAAQASPNTIQNNGEAGITVVDSSYAEIQGNVVTGNGSDGILVSDNSSARIGAQTGVADTLQVGNTIAANARNGITLSRSANARIVGNLIIDNSNPAPGVRSHGISLLRASQADIADNEISGNTGDAVVIWQNSAAILGTTVANSTSTAAADKPNRTERTNPDGTLKKNGRRGITCGLGSMVDGQLGSLIGVSGAKGYDTATTSTCVDSLDTAP